MAFNVSRTSVFLIAAAALRLGAQCPDGTPPPCRSATVATASRRANSQLNPRAFIVVPFANVTRASDLDWLREASVNLMSIDLAQWTDITVVPDQRVADLVRDFPAARNGATLTLSDGLTLARQAGAGVLVMGDFYKIGNGARIVANVFDTKNGQRIRSITQQAPNQDSLLTAFAPLARGVLAVPPPAGARLGATGTSSIAAYQEYLAGVRALNRFDLTEARRRLTQALVIDSTFALAHFKLSIAMGWAEDSRDTLEERRHALTAARLGVTLPPRERALIAGGLGEATGDFVRACTEYRSLLAKDSTDVEALYGLGECSYHDYGVERLPSDSLTGRFRTSWNVALSAFRRTLELDPTYHLAFEHILNILSSSERVGCSPMQRGGTCEEWRAVVLRQRDSLVVTPVSYDKNYRAFQAQFARSVKEHPKVASLEAARRIAQDWVDADPSEDRAHYYLGTVALSLGDAAKADEEFRAIHGSMDSTMRVLALRSRVEALVKLGRGAEARAVYDTVVRETPKKPGYNKTLGPIDAVFGRLARFNAYLTGATAANARVYYQNTPRVLLGIPRRELNADEQKYIEGFSADTTCGAGCQRLRIRPSLMYAPRAPRSWWPPPDTSDGDYRLKAAYAIQMADTAYLRRASAILDSASHANVASLYSEDGMAVAAAEAYLALRDSTKALRITRFFVDSAIKTMSLLEEVGPVTPAGGVLWPRTMLLRADLAAALGYSAEARVWYGRVLDLWAEADAEVQPTVERIRAAVAALPTAKP